MPSPDYVDLMNVYVEISHTCTYTSEYVNSINICVDFTKTCIEILHTLHLGLAIDDGEVSRTRVWLVYYIQANSTGTDTAEEI